MLQRFERIIVRLSQFYPIHRDASSFPTAHAERLTISACCSATSPNTSGATRQRCTRSAADISAVESEPVMAQVAHDPRTAIAIKRLCKPIISTEWRSPSDGIRPASVGARRSWRRICSTSRSRSAVSGFPWGRAAPSLRSIRPESPRDAIRATSSPHSSRSAAAEPAVAKARSPAATASERNCSRTARRMPSTRSGKWLYTVATDTLACWATDFAESSQAPSVRSCKAASTRRSWFDERTRAACSARPSSSSALRF